MSTNDTRAALETGLRHHKAGELALAERWYRRALETQPGNPDGLYLLGVLAQQGGKADAAVALIAKAIKRSPRNPHYHVALGEARRALGQADKALLALRKAVSLDPRNAEAQFGLAALHQAQGRLEESIRHYRKALALQPDYAEAHNNLGVALTASGDRRAALQHIRRALELRPKYADAYVNLGEALKAEGRLEEAVEAYGRAIELDSRLIEAHNNLGNVLRELGRLEAALSCYDRALALKPDYAEALNNKGTALGDLGRYDAALAAHDKALELRPDFADGHAGRGAILHILGRIEAANDEYRRALAIDPNHARANHNLALAETAAAAELEIARIEALLARPGQTEKELIPLRFALGKMCDDAGRYDEAFAHYAAGNVLKRAGLARQGMIFDPDQHTRFVDQLIAVFDAAFFEGRRDFGEPSELPVFIVGMPRSGTTLVEQILASHSRVFGAGELEDIGRIIGHLPELMGPGAGYPDCVTRIDRSAARRLAADYLGALRRHDAEAVRISDKLPGNCLHLGLVALLLPGARIVHCRRDPLDTCLSCYFNNFNRSLAFTYDLGHLGHYYRDYERLMAHWHRVIPNPRFEVDYRALVDDQEAVSRALIEFCGLEWDDACLRFYETERAVRTASLSQVRQRIYRSSLERWRHYESQLGTLRDALGRNRADRG